MSSPPAILVAVSGHGWGHAGRTAPIIRRLVRRCPNAHLLVACSPQLKEPLTGMIGASEASRLEFVDSSPVPGVLVDESRLPLAVQREATFEAWGKVVDDWPDRVRGFRALLDKSKVGLVVSDVDADVLEAAAQAQVPAASISNFRWVDVLGQLDAPAQLLRPLSVAHRVCLDIRYGLALPPVGGAVELLEGAPLVSRPTTRAREEIREQLGIPTSARLAYVGFGALAHSTLAADLLARFPPDWWFVAPGRLRLNDAGAGRRAVAIPPDDFEGQDYVAAADVCITKPAYTTVVEALAAHVPVLLTSYAHHPEGASVVSQLKQLGLWTELDEFFAEPTALPMVGELPWSTGEQAVDTTVDRLLNHAAAAGGAGLDA